MIGGAKRAILLGVICTLGVFVSPGASASLPTNGPDGPCLHRHHLPAFTAYSLGPLFEGLPRTGMFRSCYAPPHIPHVHLVGPYPHSVAWTSYVDYGTCTPEGFEGGCTDPLEIQSWPECDRNFNTDVGANSPKALPARTSYRLSGSHKIPTAALSYGVTTQIEMFTGQTTIVIFSGGPSLALSAAHALTQIVAPKVSSISAARLRAAAVSTRACRSK
jgi:hypothetical protein